jgi:uncharacterized membrane protein YjjB (DUF3815 family)
MDHLEQRRFLWGVLLAWLPWFPTVVRLVLALNNQKATGLGAIAGTMAELLVFWGLATMVFSQIAAILWLVPSFSRDHPLRSLVSAASIAASILMLLMMCFFIKLVWAQGQS